MLHQRTTGEEFEPLVLHVAVISAIGPAHFDFQVMLGVHSGSSCRGIIRVSVLESIDAERRHVDRRFPPGDEIGDDAGGGRAAAQADVSMSERVIDTRHFR